MNAANAKMWHILNGISKSATRLGQPGATGMRAILVYFFTILLGFVLPLAAEGAGKRWWADVDYECFLYGLWYSAHGLPDGQNFHLTFLGEKEGRFRVEKFVEQADSVRRVYTILGHFQRQQDRIEVHYCDPCEPGNEKDHAMTWKIVGMGTIETSYPDEMTLLASPVSIDPAFPEDMKLLIGEQSLRFLRSKHIDDLSDMFPDSPLPSDGMFWINQHLRSCASGSWRRLRPR